MLGLVWMAQGSGAVDLSNLPADPTLAWGVVAASILGALVPVFLKMKKPPEPDTPKPVAPSVSVAPALDAQSQLVSQMITNQEARLRAADENEAKLYGLLGQLQSRVATLEAEVVSLKRENDQLRGQLMRGSGL